MKRSVETDFAQEPPEVVEEDSPPPTEPLEDKSGVFQVKFNVARSDGGHYFASCAELSAFAEAPTMRELEERLRVLGRALFEEQGSTGPAHRVKIVVRRRVPVPAGERSRNDDPES